MSSNIWGQSDQGLHCPWTESLDTTECMNGEQRLGWYFAHAQNDLNLSILLMLLCCELYCKLKQRCCNSYRLMNTHYYCLINCFHFICFCSEKILWTKIWKTSLENLVIFIVHIFDRILIFCETVMFLFCFLFIPHLTIVVGYYGFTLVVHVSVSLSCTSVCYTSVFHTPCCPSIHIFISRQYFKLMSMDFRQTGYALWYCGGLVWDC